MVSWISDIFSLYLLQAYEHAISFFLLKRVWLWRVNLMMQKTDRDDSAQGRFKLRKFLVLLVKGLIEDLIVNSYILLDKQMLKFFQGFNTTINTFNEEQMLFELMSIGLLYQNVIILGFLMAGDHLVKIEPPAVVNYFWSGSPFGFLRQYSG